MSDFIANLINRHLGIGEQVQPRVRSKFEPDAAAAFLPRDTEEDSPCIKSTKPDVNSPDNQNKQVNPQGDWSSSKTTELNKSFCRGPGGSFLEKSPLVAEGIKHSETVIQSAEVETPVYSSVPHKNKPDPEEPDTSVQMPRGFSQPSITEKDSLQPLEQSDGIKLEKPRLVPTKTREGVLNQESPQYIPTTPQLSPSAVFPAERTGQEPLMAESQPILPGIPNTGPEIEGLLEAPPWLPGKQKTVHKKSFLQDPKTDAEPVINVSIGHIEVRAIQSPAPGQPGQKKKPSGVMTLDQYLSRSKQGGSP